MSFINSESTVNYVSKMNDSIETDRFNFIMEFNHLNTEWKKLIVNMLEFNPYFRQSARELLKSKLFDDIRIVENEKQSVEKIKMIIDADESFDYESCKSSKFTKPDYIKMIF
jgi:serine/threonine protein kinase